MTPVHACEHATRGEAYAHALVHLEQLAARHAYVSVDVRRTEGGADLVLEGLREAGEEMRLLRR